MSTPFGTIVIGVSGASIANCCASLSEHARMRDARRQTDVSKRLSRSTCVRRNARCRGRVSISTRRCRSSCSTLCALSTSGTRVGTTNAASGNISTCTMSTCGNNSAMRPACQPTRISPRRTDDVRVFRAPAPTASAARETFAGHRKCFEVCDGVAQGSDAIGQIVVAYEAEQRDFVPLCQCAQDVPRPQLMAFARRIRQPAGERENPRHQCFFHNPRGSSARLAGSAIHAAALSIRKLPAAVSNGIFAARRGASRANTAAT